MVTEIFIANLKGDEGPIHPETVVDLRREADNVVLARYSGEEEDLGSFKGDKGDRGDDGANVLPTDAAVSAAMRNPASETSAALVSAIGEALPPISVTAPLPGSLRAGNVRQGLRSVQVASASQHNAFPGFVHCKDGSFLVAWRQAASHEPTAIGIIRARRYDPNGTPLGNAYTVASDALDVRDPALTVLADGTLVLQVFKHNGTVHAGVYTAVSTDNGATFGPLRLVPFTWNANKASSSPVVVLADGSWLVAAYGRDSSTYFNCRLMRSTDRGATWTGETTIAEGQAQSRNLVEPYLGVRADGSLMCLIRVSDSDGSNPGIYRTVSTDNGATWSEETLTLSAAGGRPAWLVLASGAILLTYRSTVAPSPMLFRTSWDGGVTWSPAAQLGNTPANQGAYAQAFEAAPGLIAVAYAIEASTSAADLTWRYLADGFGFSPLGDNFTSVAPPSFPRDVALTDTFVRANAAVLGKAETGQDWIGVLGAIGITSNLAKTVAGAGVSIAVTNPGVIDGAVECSIRWDTGGLSGNGIIVRYIDDANFIYAAIESAGAALRLKKVSAGAVTNLDQPATGGLASETWHAVRITYRGGLIRTYINGVLLSTVTLSAADTAKYGQASQVGLRATLDGHRFGNFIVRNSFLDLPVLA